MSVAESASLPRRATRRAWEDAVTSVVARMRERLDEPLNLAEMADVAGVSRCHFDRLFRRVSGLTPRQFQTAVRLNVALRLLLTTQRSVTDVCFDVGYESLGSFITKFAETFGLPPQRLREMSARLDRSWSTWADRDVVREFSMPARPPLLDGEVTLPSTPFHGPIFIGLFATAIPLRAPLACTIVAAPGPFALGPVPDVPSYLFGVAIPWCDRPLDFLRNDHTLRGGGMRIAPATAASATLALRRPMSADPPINIALPFLIVERFVS